MLARRVPLIAIGGLWFFGTSEALAQLEKDAALVCGHHIGRCLDACKQEHPRGASPSTEPYSEVCQRACEKIYRECLLANEFVDEDLGDQPPAPKE
jgi:hypothetical protein